MDFIGIFIWFHGMRLVHWPWNQMNTPVKIQMKISFGNEHIMIFFWTKTEHEKNIKKNFAQLEAARFSCLVNPALNAETGLISYPDFTNRANSKGTQPTIGTESTLTEVGRRFFGPNYKYRTDMTCWLNSTWYPIWILETRDVCSTAFSALRNGMVQHFANMPKYAKINGFQVCKCLPKGTPNHQPHEGPNVLPRFIHLLTVAGPLLLLPGHFYHVCRWDVSAHP